MRSGCLFALLLLPGVSALPDRSILPATVPAASAPLTTVKQIRALGPEQASVGRPVRIKGKVLTLSGWKNSFFFSEGDVGISVDRKDDAEHVQPELHSGDEVEVEGKTAAGMFAPIVMAEQVRVLGPGKLPAAPPRDYADLMGGSEDSQWVQVRGVVQAAWISQSWGRRVLFVEIDLGGGRITARVHDFPVTDPSHLVDAEVRATGVCGTNFNERRQLVGLRLFVPELEGIVVEKAAPADPFSIAEQALESLGTFRIGRHVGHRVRVTGTVTYQRLGESLYLQNGNDGLYVETREAAEAPPGSRIEAVGFVGEGAYSPQLQAATFRVMGKAGMPAPAKLPAAEVIRTNADGFLTSRYDGLLVRLRATLMQRFIQGGSTQGNAFRDRRSYENSSYDNSFLDDRFLDDREVLVLRDGDTLFRAYLYEPAGQELLANVKTESVVEVTGVAAIHTDENREPHSFEVRLRTPEDIVVLQAPVWWDSRHTLYVLCAAVLALLALLAAVAGFRRTPSA